MAKETRVMDCELDFYMWFDDLWFVPGMMLVVDLRVKCQGSNSLLRLLRSLTFSLRMVGSLSSLFFSDKTHTRT